MKLIETKKIFESVNCVKPIANKDRNEQVNLNIMRFFKKILFQFGPNLAEAKKNGKFYKCMSSREYILYIQID